MRSKAGGWTYEYERGHFGLQRVNTHIMTCSTVWIPWMLLKTVSGGFRFSRVIHPYAANSLISVGTIRSMKGTH